jgi:hypothetical protein
MAPRSPSTALKKGSISDTTVVNATNAVRTTSLNIVNRAARPPPPRRTAYSRWKKADSGHLLPSHFS